MGQECSTSGYNSFYSSIFHLLSVLFFKQWGQTLAKIEIFLVQNLSSIRPSMQVEVAHQQNSVLLSSHNTQTNQASSAHLDFCYLKGVELFIFYSFSPFFKHFSCLHNNKIESLKKAISLKSIRIYLKLKA